MNKHVPRIVAAVAIFCLLTVGCTTHDSSKPIRAQDYRETIRVACVGDSITYGDSIQHRLRDCYPAQLGRMLGQKWETRNFGVSGATMLKNGDRPYWKQKAFKDALAFNPHVVIIKLGTNDTKPQNWKFRDEFVPDYADMIDRFADSPVNPRIWICYPVPAYPERWGISDSRIRNQVIPLISEVARRKRAPVIDLYGPLSNRPELFPDLIHPNAEGARFIAEEIYTALTGLQLAERKQEPALP